MALTIPSVGASGWGPSIITALRQLDSIGPSSALHATSVTAPGTVVIDAARGWLQQITLGANVTGSSIINATAGQLLIVQWIQDGSGNRSYAWPNDVMFTGGSPPSESTIPGAIDQVLFVHNGSVWQEIQRAATNSGGSPISVQHITGSGTANANTVVLVDASGGNATVTLPLSVSGAVVQVKKIDSSVNTVGIHPQSGQIDGASTFTLSVQYAAVNVYSDGTNWWVF